MLQIDAHASWPLRSVDVGLTVLHIVNHYLSTVLSDDVLHRFQSASDEHS